MSLIEFASMCDDPAMTSNLAAIELRHAKKFGTAWQARRRLQAVIATDRAAVPCGRWVRLRPNFSAYHFWALQNVFGQNYKKNPPPKIDRRPRYRYEVRR